jgi:hypothetical protein
MPYPWEKGHVNQPLHPALYSMAQRLAAEGKLPRDHPAWLLTERDEQRYMQEIEPDRLDDEIADVLAIQLSNDWD